MSNIIDNIRESMASFKLKRALKKHPHKATTYNLQTAQTAGILYDADNPDNLKVVKELVNELKESGIKSQALGYISKTKREDNYIGDDVYSFVSKKDFSLFYSPKSESIKNFIDSPFHLLIVLTNNYQFAIDYMGNLSQAKFKIGRANIDNNLYDLMIEVTDDASISDLKKHILHYLSIINNK